MTVKTQNLSTGSFAMIIVCTGIGWFLAGTNGAVFGATFWSMAIIVAATVSVYRDSRSASESAKNKTGNPINDNWRIREFQEKRKIKE